MVSYTKRGYRNNPITSMKKRHATEQVITILRQADTGKTVQEICRGNNVSEQTFYRWLKKYGNLVVIMGSNQYSLLLAGHLFESMWTVF